MRYNLVLGCFCMCLVSTCLAQTGNETESPTEKTSTPSGSTAGSTTPASTVEESKWPEIS